MSDKVQMYFGNDDLAANVWLDKYCLKDRNGVPQEETPTDMHWRMAKEFARIELGYIDKEFQNIQTTTNLGSDDKMIDFNKITNLSKFGQELMNRRFNEGSLELIEQEFFNYFDKFNQIVPQGSIMSNLGNFFVYGSLSNCFGISDPYDSYGGIMRTDEHLAQLMKRRGGVGLNLDNIRPSGTMVTNASKSSTGVVSYAERYSNTTREVAQEGRRGALMELLFCMHPDIFKFVTMKDDRTKVTGANVSVKFTDEFMEALEKDEDFYCRFPVDCVLTNEFIKYQELGFEPYNILIPIGIEEKIDGKIIQVMKIKPQELFDLVAEMAWKNGEPGVAFYDRVVDYSPEGVYDIYKAVVCNPCGEQWFAANETCRLIALNFWSIVLGHFQDAAFIDFDLLYELAYMQQRLGDNLVDLECEYIDRIIMKIASDPEPADVKFVELQLWQDIQKIAKEGRRTGGGFTALGDMLAALNLKYDSDEAIATVEKVMKTKMRAELDCTIDMAILRGTFVGWNRNKEMDHTQGYGLSNLKGENSFFTVLIEEFPEQAKRMFRYGRRNTNWSTVAPTGSVSILTQTTSGLEPLFKAYYIRRKKINPSEAGVRIDFTDQNGDNWQEYAVLHPKFKEWIKKIYKYGDKNIEWLGTQGIKDLFTLSPWYKSEADDISWEKRIDIQAIIQKYTSNAISSTINLPKDIPQQVVKDIYLKAYYKGLKGVTVYRDGSRSGVLVHETEKAPKDKFGYTDAIKRPKELEAHYYTLTVQKQLFAVIVGTLNNLPYELFAFEDPLKEGEFKGKLIKHKKGIYEFQSINYTIENVQLGSHRSDERNLTRFVSSMLRHGMNPKHIIEQVEKSEVSVVSFPKAVSRVLKKYLPDEETKSDCPQCEGGMLVYEEGCKKCNQCGYSAC